MMIPTETVQLRYEVETKDIAYIVSLFECYENFAIVRTIDRDRGWIELITAPHFVEETVIMMKALASEISLRRIEDTES